MGSYYYLYDKECPCCGNKIDEIIFATNSYDKDGNERGFDTWFCTYCETYIRIDMNFVLSEYNESEDC